LAKKLFFDLIVTEGGVVVGASPTRVSAIIPTASPLAGTSCRSTIGMSIFGLAAPRSMKPCLQLKTFLKTDKFIVGS
jgi:hypothetical protein